MLGPRFRGPGDPGMQSFGNPVRQDRREARGSPLSMMRAATAGMVVFAFWLVVSASLAPADLLLGAALSALLGWWSTAFLWARDSPGLSPRQLIALLRYLAAFVVTVFRAALHVARVVLAPALPIQPRMVVCHTRLQQRAARIAFALSVSLTPGTLTVDIDGAAFLVHCLDEESARRLLDGELERQVARVFEQGVAS